MPVPVPVAVPVSVLICFYSFYCSDAVSSTHFHARAHSIVKCPPSMPRRSSAHPEWLIVRPPPTPNLENPNKTPLTRWRDSIVSNIWPIHHALSRHTGMISGSSSTNINAGASRFQSIQVICASLLCAEPALTNWASSSIQVHGDTSSPVHIYQQRAFAIMHIH